jgi:DNA-binding response OmpR family regulator
MNHKVLLADDSLTIQKVIKITLANQPYDITDCSSEEELFRQLPLIQPKLVFLDFNLSDKFTGYELTTKIKSLLPSTKVLLLLGTFDTVDDASMEKCGASDKIVKPFDSNKFIAICKQLIETFADNSEIPYPETKVAPKNIITEDPEDQWTVSHTTEQKFQAPDKKAEPASAKAQNALMKEVSDWGMSVPSIIDDESSHTEDMDFPPIIGEVKSLNEVRAQKYETKYPANEDLDYPTIEELTAKAPEPKSKLISIDSFNDEPLDLELESNYVPDETDVSSIEAQIQDEVADNLWQVDEFEDLKKEVSSKIEAAKNNFQPSLNDFDESLFKPQADETPEEEINWNEPGNFFAAQATEQAQPTFQQPSIDMDQMKREMEAMVKKYVKEYMDEFFQKNTEKVAWEVIPDLAENLIRQELSKISNKIINE